MSTRERLYNLVGMLNAEDIEVVYQILKRFAMTSDTPNQETIEAMLEADEIAHDPNVKGYTSIEELMEDLESE
jgi:hypothetical protein